MEGRGSLCTWKQTWSREFDTYEWMVVAPTYVWGLGSFLYMKLEVASVFLCHKKVSRARISAYCISGLCKAAGKGHPCNGGEAKTFGGSQNASFWRMSPQLPIEDLILDLPVLGDWGWQSQNHEPERGKQISSKITNSWFYWGFFHF